MGASWLVFLISEGRFPASRDTTPLRSQPVAVLVQVHQREGRAKPLVVLPQAPVAHLCKSGVTLQDAERMLHLGPNSGLGRIPAPGLFIHRFLNPVRRLVISCASGAVSWIASVCR